MFPELPGLPGRASGILLHPTSLPGPYGIGDIGPNAYAWLRWLRDAGCSLWQILPLGPTGYADSPYQSFSTFAGNHLLISPDLLLEHGWITGADLESMPSFPASHVAYGDVIPWKERLLDRAAASFFEGASKADCESFEKYCEDQKIWLEDYALFMAIKSHYCSEPWTTWQPALRDRVPETLQQARTALRAGIKAHKLRQYLFHLQWSELKAAAEELGITILGDIPLYVAHDSADVWASPDYYQLTPEGHPRVVAGVPPDYFSATGQRWGNPLYHYDQMRIDGYAWWVRRFSKILEWVDVVRLDHFRGFESYWEIPAEQLTAIYGRWVPGPGSQLLDRLEQALHGLPLIAEDLGVITGPVIALRKSYGLPGMKVMQFGFEGGHEHEFLPHNYQEGFVAYTGTHDNDTTKGWYETQAPEIQAFARSYLVTDGEHIAWDMMEALWASVAAWVIAPMQDPLELGSEARMNFPGLIHGNWRWRLLGEQLTEPLAGRIRALNNRHNR